MITVFAARKISLYSMIADIEFQLSLINQKRINLSSVGMMIADGQVSPDEMQQANYYTQNGVTSVVSLGNVMTQQSAMMGQPMAMVYRNPYNPNVISIHDKVKEVANAQLAAQEKTLDLQSKQLETKLSMYTKELETTEKAEGESIKRATPNYTGVA